MIDVSDRADVDVRFRSLKLLFCHLLSPDVVCLFYNFVSLYGAHDQA